MLAVYEKILELCAHIQLSTYFEENKLFNENQFGFRKNHSTETAVQLLISKWRAAIDDDMFVIAVMLDLKRAFETINREVLFEKLKCYKVGGVVLQWIKNYLTGRTQRVRIGNQLSSELLCDVGVPQGSVLGPLLFIIYMNDINSCTRYVNINLFADDTLVCIEGNNYEESMMKLNLDLEVVATWFSGNGLKLNASKSMGMLITSSKVKYLSITVKYPNVYIILENERVELSECVKYLGIKMDNVLNFSEHIKYVADKIARITGYFTRVAKYLTRWIKTLIFNTIIAPHFQYCASLFLDASINDIKILQKLQNKAMRTILKCDWFTHSKDMLVRLDWLSVKENIQVKVLTFIHNTIQLQKMDAFQGFCKKNSEMHNYCTRNAAKYHLKIQNKKSGQKSILCNGIKLYNKLPNESRLLDKKAFKKFVVKRIKENGCL
jgi:hypothetical protein